MIRSVRPVCPVHCPLAFSRVEGISLAEGSTSLDLYGMIVILRTAANTDIMIAGMVVPTPNYRLPRAFRVFSFACPYSPLPHEYTHTRARMHARGTFPLLHIHTYTLSLSLSLSLYIILSRSVFFSELARERR